MKSNFVKTQKKNRHYSQDQIDRIRRNKKMNKVTRGRREES